MLTVLEVYIMSTIGDRIKHLRFEKNYTREELGRKLGMTVTAISNWETGCRLPTCQSIIMLANVFRVTADYILGITDSREPSGFNFTAQDITLINNYRKLDKYGRLLVDEVFSIENNRMADSINTNPDTIIPFPERYIPLYVNPSAAGLSASLDGDDFEMVLVNDSVPKNADFAVKIQGNSMYPIISDGDIVYVRRCEQIPIGAIGIFCVEGSMYCKQYYLDKNGLLLKSLNPEMQSANIFISGESDIEVRCYGEVLQ